MGSEGVEAVNAVSADRCNPHPHVFSDRLLRPGDQAFFDIIHSFMGYRTCYYRTFNVGYATPSQIDAYKQCREWLDAAIELVRPGVTTDEIAAAWPTAEEIGMQDERAAFGLQFGHGLGVGLYEFPMISRLKMLRQWGGIVDMTGDRSPILSTTPLGNCFVNCGWGTGGFKAIPGSGWSMADLIAKGEPGPLSADFGLGRFREGRFIDESVAAGVAH